MQLALVGRAGIQQVRVLLAAHELRVRYDPDRVTAADIIAAVRRAPASGESGNYDAIPIAPTPQPAVTH